VVSENMLLLGYQIALLFPVFLLIFTVRGFAKSLAAYMTGDTTAYHAGFVSFNPLVHIDIYGMLIVLTVLFFLGGLMPGGISRSFLYLLLIAFSVRWTFPVPIMQQNFRNMKLGVLCTTLAGPIANCIVALISMYVVRYAVIIMARPAAELFGQLCSVAVDVALFFAVIDLIPLPPFDGAAFLQILVPARYYGIVEWLEDYSLFTLLVLFVVPGTSDFFFAAIAQCKSIIASFLYMLVW